jgi:phosphotransferase system  glucose/maltose/N-acetylglucosamine-specific IIC component
VAPPLADTLTQTARLVSNSANAAAGFVTLGPTLEDATRNIAAAISNASAAATERVQQSTNNSKQRQEWMGQLWPYILSALSGTALAMAARAADHRKKAKEKKV